jgi:hypothetical protein
MNARSDRTFDLDIDTLIHLTDDLYVKLLEVADVDLVALDEDLPMPFDATVSVDGNELVITGSAGPCGVGSAVVRLPLKGAANALAVVVRPGDAQLDANVRQLLAGSRVGYEETNHATGRTVPR